MQDLSTDTVSLLTDHPVPLAQPDSQDHLIRMHAAGLCARELTWPKYFPPTNPDREMVPAYDMAGTVVAAPPSSPFQPGAEVYARTNYHLRAGCASDYTIAVTSELALKPTNLNWTEAAAVSLSALTAWQALFVQAGLAADIGGDSSSNRNAGKRLLITGASGGVGVWVVQLARLAGLEVVGTCGPDNMALVRELGATEVINYRTTGLADWASEEAGRKVDVVIDCVGGRTLQDCWACVKDGGLLISIFQPPEEMKPVDLAAKDVKSLFFIMEPNGEQLSKITALLEMGKCRPVIDSVWKLEDFEKAYARVDGGHAKGKVVLRIKD